MPVSKLGEKSAGIHSFFSVLGRFGKVLVWGYTLSCLLANWEEECRGRLFLSSIIVRFGKVLVRGYTLSCLLANWERRVQGYTLSFQF